MWILKLSLLALIMTLPLAKNISLDDEEGNEMLARVDQRTLSSRS